MDWLFCTYTIFSVNAADPVAEPINEDTFVVNDNCLSPKFACMKLLVLIATVTGPVSEAIIPDIFYVPSKNAYCVVDDPVIVNDPLADFSTAINPATFLGAYREPLKFELVIVMSVSDKEQPMNPPVVLVPIVVILLVVPVIVIEHSVLHVIIERFCAPFIVPLNATLVIYTVVDETLFSRPAYYPH